MGVLALPISDLKRGLFTYSPLLRWRKRPSFGAAEACVLAIYTTLLALAVPHHEPWGDEAQAWLVARDNSFWQIFRRRLHYEGSPPLWHFILRMLHLLHVPWSAIGWCGAAFAIAGVAVWLRWSPLPPILRWLFPFTFFMQYQYAVVARSYVIFPLLLFTLCSVYRSREVRPASFAIASGLLACLCMQGMVVSVVITLLYVIEVRKQWGYREGALAGTSRRRLYAATGILLGFWGVSIYAAMPAPDASFPAVHDQVSGGSIHNLLVRMLGETPTNHPAAVPPDYTPDQWKAISDATVPPEPNWRTAPREWLAWEMRAPEPRRNFSDGWNSILFRAVMIPSELFWPIGTSNLLVILFLVSLLIWARSHQVLRYLLPMFSLLIVGEFVWIQDHHSGMLLVVLVAGVWLGAPKPGEAVYPNCKADQFFVLLAAVIFLNQAGWSAVAIHRDRMGSYDPSSETALYLHTKPPGTTMAAFHFWSTGIQPYFDRNPFLNLPSSWWQWCSNIVVDAAHRETIAKHPSIVVYTYENPEPDGMRNQILPLNRLTGYEPADPILIDLRNQGYRETHRYCGRRFDRWSAAYTVCDVIFEPGPGEVAGSLASAH